MDHECSDACARDLRRAARLGRHVHEHIDANLPANRLYRRLARAVDRTACIRARMLPRSGGPRELPRAARQQIRHQLDVCSCLVRGAPGG